MEQTSGGAPHLVSSEAPNWADLALDVLAKIGAGDKSLAHMRQVCSAWRAGYDASVTFVCLSPSCSPPAPAFTALLHRLPQLASLDLRGHPQADEVFAAIGAASGELGPLPLTSIVACASRLSLAGLQGLREGTPLLETLDIAESRGLTPEGLRTLRGLPLGVLDLGCAQGIDSGCVEAMEGLPLRVLDISEATLSDEGMRALGGVTSLVMLSLARCKGEVTKVGFRALREGLPSLESLDLSRTSLYDDPGLFYRGAELESGVGSEVDDSCLAELAGLPLTDLNLEDCGGITDEGLLALEGMPLRGLYLDGCESLSDEAVERLKQAGVNVFFHHHSERDPELSNFMEGPE